MFHNFRPSERMLLWLTITAKCFNDANDFHTIIFPGGWADVYTGSVDVRHLSVCLAAYGWIGALRVRCTMLPPLSLLITSTFAKICESDRDETAND